LLSTLILGQTAGIAEACGARVLVVSTEEFDHGGTRTLAGKAATGDILIYMTQDVTLSGNHSIEHIIRPFEDQAVGASYGRQLPYPDADEFGELLRLFNYPEVSYTASLEDRKHMVSGLRFCPTPLPHTEKGIGGDRLVQGKTDHG